jgi:NADPH:quinone reductase
MPHAIVVREPGGPEVLRNESIEVGAPAEGELRIRQTAIGVNFHDVGVRMGLTKVPLPVTPGAEAAGVIEAVGAGVSGFAVGDRVAYVTTKYGSYGGYSSERLLPSSLAVKVPAGVSDEVAAAIMLKGLTAELLLHRTYRVTAGSRVLVHAAAGGVGLLLCEWARALGATVIGTAGTEEKADAARQAGAHHVILYRQEDFVARVNELTGGKGVDVVYDSVGKDTFSGSIDCLAMFGRVVSFGQASGPIEPLDLGRLSAKSASVARAVVFHYIADSTRMTAMCDTLFAAIRSGAVGVRRITRYGLAEAADAHRALQSRASSGSLILIP